MVVLNKFANRDDFFYSEKLCLTGDQFVEQHLKKRIKVQNRVYHNMKNYHTCTYFVFINYL